MEMKIVEEIARAAKLVLDSPLISSGNLREIVVASLDRLIARPGIRNIIALPCLAGRFLRERYRILPRETRICMAIGLAGWAAWTAADDIRDGDCEKTGGKSAGIMLAEFSLLSQVMHALVDKLGLSAAGRRKIASIIGAMEEANCMEGSIDVRRRSVDKSLSVIIPVVALMMKAGASNADIAAFEDSFRHFILARQLSDDALDWKEDVANGERTAVIELIEEAFAKDLRSRIAGEIVRESQQALRGMARISCFTDLSFLEDLPAAYKNMAERILRNGAVDRGSRT